MVNPEDIARLITEDPDVPAESLGGNEHICLKIVNPGSWPKREGMIIPGYVLPPNLSNSPYEWTSGKFTRDVMGTQTFEYIVYVPDSAIIEKHKHEWVVKSKCRYKLNRIISLPLEENSDHIPNKIGIIIRPDSYHDGGIGGNLAIDLDKDINDQLEELANWENDNFELINITNNTITIYSENIEEETTYKLKTL
jgi:hypothetical protein